MPWKKMNKREIQLLARNMTLSDEGNKQDIIDRIIAKSRGEEEAGEAASMRRVIPEITNSRDIRAGFKEIKDMIAMIPRKSRPGFMYVLFTPETGTVECKIGKAKDVKKRIKTFRTASPSIAQRDTYECEDYTHAEQVLITFMKHHRLVKRETAGKEWYRVGYEIGELICREAVNISNRTDVE